MAEYHEYLIAPNERDAYFVEKRLKRGATLAGYKILYELGRGGMGIVYKASEKSLRRVVALKVLAPYLASDPEYVERFQREAQAVGRISHPNIAHVYSVGEEDGVHYIAMELVKGVTLDRFIKDSGPLKVGRALKFTGQAAQALAQAHAHGVSHRDLKPANLMVDSTGRIRVMDFGLAFMGKARTPITSKGILLGTPMYMSPEQCRGVDVGPRSDIYSLGVCLYEMLTGRVPFVSNSPLAIMHQIVNEPLRPVSDFVPTIPEDVVRILEVMMAPDQEDRYQTAKEVATDIRSVLKGEPPSVAFNAVDTDIPGEEITGLRLSDIDLEEGETPLEFPEILGGEVSRAFYPSTPRVEHKNSTFSSVLLVSVLVLLGAVIYFRAPAPTEKIAVYVREPLPERTLYFPSAPRLLGEHLGLLTTRDWDDPSFEGFSGDSTNVASGTLRVREGKDVDVRLDASAKGALEFYATLPVDTFQGIKVEESYGLQPNELNYISHMINLELLDIDIGESTHIDIAPLAGMARLKYLSIQDAALTDDDLKYLGQMKSLEYLGLRKSAIEGPGLGNLSDKTSIVHIDLDLNKISDAGLLNLRNLHALEVLKLTSSRVTDSGMKTLLQFPRLKELILDQGQGYRSNSGLNYVVQLDKLERLGIKFCNVDATGLEILSNHPALASLSIDAKAIDARAAVALAQMPALRELDLSWSRPSVSKQTIRLLKTCTQLRTLNIKFNESGDELVPALKDLTFLESLHLEGTKISRRGRTALSAALPHCKITH